MNRSIADIEAASLGLSFIVLVVAGLLGYRERLDRLGRTPSLNPEDFHHFRKRDRRRSLGLSILCLLALGIVVVSRTPIRVGLHANPWFLIIWLAIFGLISFLLCLALVDWFDLRRYAHRKKAAMGREHLTLIQDGIDRWKREIAAAETHPDQTEPPAH